MPFIVNFQIDEDKMGQNDSRAGMLTVSYSDPIEATLRLGHWRHSERYEAGDPTAAAAICANFEGWVTRRTLEVEIEAALKSELDPLCPCHEDEVEDTEGGPEA